MMNEADFKIIAQRHNLSLSAVQALAMALHAGNCRMAQFSHPELGGMGQWMPTMIMVGDMFNHQLKAQVDAVCRELVGVICNETAQPTAMKPLSFSEAIWWKSAGLESVDTSGGQNDLAYAYSAKQNRLAVKRGEAISLYDTKGYRIHGVSQQQSNAHKTLLIHTDQGDITLSELLNVK